MSEQPYNKFAEICLFDETSTLEQKKLRLFELFKEDLQNGLTEFHAFVASLDSIRLQDKAELEQIEAAKNEVIDREFNVAQRIYQTTRSEYYARVEKEYEAAEEAKAKAPLRLPEKKEEYFPDDLDAFEPRTLFTAMEQFKSLDEAAKRLDVEKGLKAAFAKAKEEVQERVTLRQDEIYAEHERHKTQQDQITRIAENARLLESVYELLNDACRHTIKQAVKAQDAESAFTLNDQEKYLREAMDDICDTSSFISTLQQQHNAADRRFEVVLGALQSKKQQRPKPSF